MSFLSPRAPVNTQRQAKHKTRTRLASITGVFYPVFRYSEEFSGEIGPIHCMQTRHTTALESLTRVIPAQKLFLPSDWPLLHLHSNTSRKGGKPLPFTCTEGFGQGLPGLEITFQNFSTLPSRNNAKHVIFNTQKKKERACSLLKCCTSLRLGLISGLSEAFTEWRNSNRHDWDTIQLLNITFWLSEKNAYVYKAGWFF